MQKDVYAFIAVASFESDGIAIHFPDLAECYSCASSEDEVFAVAKEVLGLTLWSRENDNETIPTPTSLKNIKVADNETTMFVEVYMPLIRDKIRA